MSAPLPPVRSSVRRGFTLVELLLVVLLLGIIAAGATPMFRDADAARLRAAARLLADDLNYARADGITRSDDPIVLVARPTADGGDGGYHLARTSAPADPVLDPVARSPYDTTFGTGRAGHLPGVQLTAAAIGDDARLGFGLYGQLDQSAPATFTLQTGPTRVDLTVHPSTGEVTVSDHY